MKKTGILTMAAVFSFSAAAMAADTSFEDSLNDIQSSVSDLKAPPQPRQQHNNVPPPSGPQQPHPQPPQQPHQPVQPPHGGPVPQPGHGGNGQWNDHNNGDHHDWDHHEPRPYEIVYPDMNCLTMQFTAQGPNSQTQQITAEEYTADCYNDANGTRYCRPTGNYYSRKIAVNIGPRQLESWEKENLKVCLDPDNIARLDVSDMLYDYSVSSKDHDGFFGGRSTEFNLTPGAKRPSKPDMNELGLASVVTAPSGAVMMTISDGRASYFKGGRMEINAEGMNIPNIDPNMPVQDVINSFVNIKVSGSFDTAETYTLKLMDNVKPGKYAVTLNYRRTGPMASGDQASTIVTFELK